MASLYDFPALFEAVTLPARPPELVEAEVRTIQALHERHGLTRGHVLELACGLCPHGWSLASHGYRVTGLDRSAAMLAEARRRTREAGLDIDLVEGDLFDLPWESPRFDSAIFMY